MDRLSFIKTAGTYSLLFPFIKPFAGTEYSGEIENERQLMTICLKAFQRFDDVWAFNDFWRRGNTFDACLNFADALHSRWPDDERVQAIQEKISGMLEKDFTYFESIDPDAMWADDFGWWGLMGLNARRHLKRTGNTGLADKYLHLSTDLCWRQARDNAYDFSPSEKPVAHGFRNGDARGRQKGVKNTVTNVLFFLLSTRIYRMMLAEDLKDSEKYIDMAYRQWIWFDTWFGLTKYEYLKETLSGGALVQERPTAFFNGSGYTDVIHPTWHKGWVWTGDQGMMLAALSDLLAMKDHLSRWVTTSEKVVEFDAGSFSKKIQDYIALISRGIKTTLICDKDNIIREAPQIANMGPEFGSDYLAGRGIMMRYLGTLDKNITGVDFRSSIAQTADAIWQTRDRVNNQFRQEYTNVDNDRYYIRQFSREWGHADNILKWDIEKSSLQQRIGVCQSIGLDALGATLRLV